MRTGKVLLVLAAILVVLAAVQALAQEKSQITVKNTEVVTGVVIVDVVKGDQKLELRCNQGASFCKALKSGTYQMVELPEHWGMYECKNAEIYDNPVNGQEAKEKIGAYCITTK